MLLVARANPNSLKEDKASPLFIASQAGHREVVVELLRARGDPDLARENNVTPVFMAVQNQHSSTLASLLEGAAKPDVPRQDGVTPLILAAQLGGVEIVRQLLAAQADPTKTSSIGNSPIKVAKSKAVTKALLDARAEPNASSAASHMMHDMQNASHSVGGDAAVGAVAGGARQMPKSIVAAYSLMDDLEGPVDITGAAAPAARLRHKR